MTINIITTAVNFRNIKFRPEEFQEILLDKEIIIIFLYFLSVSWKRHVMEFLEKKVVHIAYIQAIKMFRDFHSSLSFSLKVSLEILDSLKNTMTHIFDGHLLMPLAYPKTRPGQFGHEPWKESKLGLLEQKLEAWSASLEHRKQHLKRLQDQSDSDTERIEIVNKHVQSMLSILENLDTEIMLEKQPEKKLRKTAKVSKQQEKKLRQIAKSGKQTTKVPKQQKKVASVVWNSYMCMEILSIINLEYFGKKAVHNSPFLEKLKKKGYDEKRKLARMIKFIEDVEVGSQH
ncbi:hypothetical protein P8452_45538 [Trifolium repens]|nr:hypothetical protein P8452_45538 [Trifolium repens]